MSDKMKLDVIDKMFSGKDEMFERRRSIRDQKKIIFQQLFNDPEMKSIMSSPGMFSFPYEEILALIKEKYIKFKEDWWRGFTLMKNKRKREIDIMRDLMPIYRENILENEGLEPFSLN